MSLTTHMSRGGRRRVVLLACALSFGAMALGACAETVRCPEDQVFDDRGACVPIPDGGPTDAGPD